MKFGFQKLMAVVRQVGRVAGKFVMWVAITHAIALLSVMLVPPLVIAHIDLNAARSQLLALRGTLKGIPSIEASGPRPALASDQVIERTTHGLSIRTVANEWPDLIGARRCTVRRQGTAAAAASLEVATSVYLVGLGAGRRWPDVPDHSARALGMTKPQLMAAAVEHCVLHEEGD